jgi:hypothetical protein
MASINIGPGGIAVQGEHQCSNNNYLGDQGNPLGALIETVTEQRITGMVKMRYPTTNEEVDRHMPMRALTSQRANGVITYRTSVAYENLLNAEGGSLDITPATAGYNNPRQLLDACGGTRDKNIGSRANTNAEACNPVIDGPLPIIGREEYGRRSFVSRLPIPPMCFHDFVNKENFLMHLEAVMDSVQNGLLARWGADQLRWIIGNTRYLASGYQVSQGNGKAKLPVSADLFSANAFGFLPSHWGSADWMAGMLRLSEIDPRQNLTVHLPTAIFVKYKEQLLTSIGVHLYQDARNLTSVANGFIRDIQNETLVYQDRIYGRKITFVATMQPIYVEVEETLENGGSWQLQEEWIHRDSETAGQVMARHNPNWGIACSCANKTLAAIVVVSADGEKAFYKEPLPNANPAAGINGLIDRYAKGKGATVNTTLAQMYPSSVEMTILTGLDAQVYMLDPINRRYRDAGIACDVANNVENVWIAGYAKIAAQHVENNPRSLVAFLLKMPNETECVDLSVACADADAIPEAGAFEPRLNPLAKQVVEIPEPEEPAEPAAGALFPVGKSTTVVAPCTGTKEVNVLIRRVGGTAGALTLNVAGTPSAHGGTVPGTVEFADGETEKNLTWEIDAWACENPEQETETFVLTFSGDLGEDAIETRRICIKCNKACPAECEGDVGGCASC